MTKNKMYSSVLEIHRKTYQNRIINKSKIDSNGCWIWVGKKTQGYGKMSVKKKWFLAHRISYEMFIGEIGDNLVLHKCNIRDCVNPDHLKLGNHTENYFDMIKAGNLGLVGKHSVPETEKAEL